MFFEHELATDRLLNFEFGSCTFTPKVRKTVAKSISNKPCFFAYCRCAGGARPFLLTLSSARGPDLDAASAAQLSDARLMLELEHRFSRQQRKI